MNLLQMDTFFPTMPIANSGTTPILPYAISASDLHDMILDPIGYLAYNS
jgi:hypothetical protein